MPLIELLGEDHNGGVDKCPPPGVTSLWPTFLFESTKTKKKKIRKKQKIQTKCFLFWSFVCPKEFPGTFWNKNCWFSFCVCVCERTNPPFCSVVSKAACFHSCCGDFEWWSERQWQWKLKIKEQECLFLKFLKIDFLLDFFLNFLFWVFVDSKRNVGHKLATPGGGNLSTPPL